MPRPRAQRVLAPLWSLSITLAPTGTARRHTSAGRAADVTATELRERLNSSKLERIPTVAFRAAWLAADAAAPRFRPAN
jgi:hypothetical protein